MSKYKLELSGMTCGACEKIIERTVQGNGGQVKEIDANNGYVVLTCGEDKIPVIKEQLAQKGFGARNERALSGEGGAARGENAGEAARGNPVRIFNYISMLFSADQRLEAEARFVNYSIAALVAILVLDFIAYYLFFAQTPNSPAYIPLLFLAVITSIAATFSYYNAKCYGGLSCTNGMMIGMTMGMIPGFMVGAIIGASNGMFVGSLSGMLLGIFLGVKAGKCCGIMGAMEGVMGGLMSGIMGAMTIIMLLNDNLLPFLFIAFAICIVVLGSLSYMLYREMGPMPKNNFVEIARFVGVAILFNVALLAIMLLAPKGPLRLV